MDWREYQEKSRKTAIYPNEGNNLAYPSLGLIGEYGEFLEKWYSWKETGEPSAVELEAEIGDVFWYFAAVCREAGLDMQSIVYAADKEAINGTMDIFTIAEIAKKVQRDGRHTIEEKGLEQVLVSLWSYITIVLYPLSEEGAIHIGSNNLDKLLDRKDRGVLQGNGDNR